MKEQTNFRITPQTGGEKLSRSVSLAALLLTCLCILSFGCIGPTNVSGPGDPDADIHLDGVEFEGKFIKARISESQGLLASDEFWFDASDDDLTLIYGWNDVLYRERAKEVEVDGCSHPIASRGCRECRVCSRTCNDSNPIDVFIPTPDEIASLKKAPTNGQFVTLHNFFSLPAGCQPSTLPQNTFTTVLAEDKSVYMLKHEDFVISDGSAFQKSVFFETNVVSTPQDLKKDMESYSDPSDPTTVRYKYTTYKYNGKLAENFSTSLKITRVRFLLGTRDPKTNVVMYREDPEALKKARPSRFLFLPNFAGGSINAAENGTSSRCYLDPLADDGGFNLEACRSYPPTDTGNAGVIRSHRVTPTYVNGFNQDTLTWVAEYKVSDGLPPAEAFGVNEFPVIVWTIE